ncbi:hypothetical protein WCX18_08760 [Sulfurimonas sp. HSL1-2]|uniref:hypothetical protein n=1 Tax=Thiomicrolovo zhangzhouensis TaxID=3131933 RepID=UPI0031F91C63
MKYTKIYLIALIILFTGCNSNSSSKQLPDTKTWSTPEPFFQSSGYSVTEIDSQGNIIIVTWHYNNNNGHYELIRHESRGNIWCEAELISNVPNQSYNPVYKPVVAMDNNGNAIIVWYQTGEVALIITEFRNGFWSPPRVLSYLDAGSSGHSVAMNDLGHAIIVWETNNTIYKTESMDGDWSTPEPVATGYYVRSPEVRINAEGNGVLIWREDYNATLVSSELVQGVWNTPKTVGTTESVLYDVEMDESGNAIVVWMNQNDTGTNAQIYMNELKSNVWSGPKSVSMDGVHTINPNLALSANGNAIITWQQLMGTAYQIYRIELMDGYWDTPVPVSSAGIESVNPLAKIDKNGNAILVWNEKNGSSWQLMMSQLIQGSWTDGEYFTSSDNTLNPINYDMDMNCNGEAVFVWGQSDNDTWYEYRSLYNQLR